MTHLQARRMAALGIDRPVQQMVKVCLFPGNFASAQKWFGE